MCHYQNPVWITSTSLCEVERKRMVGLPLGIMFPPGKKLTQRRLAVTDGQPEFEGQPQMTRQRENHHHYNCNQASFRC